MQPEEDRGELRKPSLGAASIVAAIAFAYTLVVTVALLLLESFFEDRGNQRTILVWLLVPIVASFFGWVAVSGAKPVFKVLVWFLVLAILFFCWISIFTIGLYYLPVPFLMVMSVLGPWDGQEEEREG